MNKPIFVIGLPTGTNRSDLENASKNIKHVGLEKDYYVLVYIDSKAESMIFKLFNADDVDDQKIADIQQMIKSYLFQSFAVLLNPHLLI